jgi:hypothetical protein
MPPVRLSSFTPTGSSNRPPVTDYPACAWGALPRPLVHKPRAQRHSVCCAGPNRPWVAPRGQVFDLRALGMAGFSPIAAPSLGRIEILSHRR